MKPRGAQSVMASRASTRDALDDFPTPPWATRAFLHHVMVPLADKPLIDLTAWEPAANRRFMARALGEYFGQVFETDIEDYGAGVSRLDFISLRDGLGLTPLPGFAADVDWIVTNPPFKDLQDWIDVAMKTARVGFALLCRTAAIETVDRFEKLWKAQQGHLLFAQYVERVPMVEGRCDPAASSATAYGWIVWKRAGGLSARVPMISAPLVFIPPCRGRFEKSGDYVVKPRVIE